MDIRAEIERICAGGFLGPNEARMLAPEDWLGWCRKLKKDDRNEALLIYHFCVGYLHEIEEGYADDSNNLDVLKRLLAFALRPGLDCH